MIKTIFFDLDGTLIDTEPSAARAIARCFERWKITLASEDARFITGRTWATAFDYLFNKYTLPVSTEEASASMMAEYRKEIHENLVEVKGSVQAVLNLAAHYPLALISGSHRQEILWALDRLHIRHCFQAILGAEDYPRSKPAPDGYLKALDLLKAEKKSTLVFEDSEPGIESALAAGLKVVAITSTNHFGHVTDQAHHHIPHLEQVGHEWVKNLKFENQ